MRPETVPLVVLALLLLSTQSGVESFTTVVGGSQEVETTNDALLLVDGNVTVPADTTANTSLYVLDGSADVAGTLGGSIVQFAGEVSFGPNATVTGSYEAFGGERTVAEGAAVSIQTVAEPLTTRRSPAERVGILFLQALALGALSFLVGRRYADLLENVAHSVRVHPVVSGTVGLLASVTLLALFVFMAFTLVLLPVSVLGLLGSVIVLVYAYVAVGFLLGGFLPLSEPGPATAAGTVGFLLVSEALSLVPVVGGLVPVAVLLVGVGAVVITYFGLREFHPPTLQSVAE